MNLQASSSLENIFGDLISNFASGIPRIFGAIVIIIIGIIVARIIRKIVKKVLESVGIDKLGDKLNEIEMINKADVEIKFSSILAKIVYYVLVLFFLMAATSQLQMEAVSDLVQNLIEFIPNLIVAGIILTIGFIFAEMLKTIVQTALTSFGIPSAKLISSFFFYFILINIVVSALSQAKIDTGFLGQNISILIGGIVLAFSIGYGLASKSTMANFIGSQYMKGKITIGDTIKVREDIGKVIAMDKSAITIEKESGGRVYVPLSKMTTESIEIL